MFVDFVRITVKAGRGGNGCRSFYQDKYSRYKKPDGGDGGRGANIIIRADKNLFTLYDFKCRRRFSADVGENGSSNRKRGKDASHKVILVPEGTIVFDGATDCKLRELLEDGQEVIAARGGEGGKGNAHAPEDEGLSCGLPGEEKELVLDLKLIADVSLVGFPNSGKSTLISKITKAHPKIASYPFTTKEPVLGMVKAQDIHFSVADIPGLIKDSHMGRGLGDKFLRHIERTKVLVHLIDMAASEGRNPVEDYRIIDEELKFYSPQVHKKPRIIAANKMDLPSAKENLANFKKALNKKVVPISALEAAGLKELLDAIQKRLFTNCS
jgi:GTP-binding protein